MSSNLNVAPGELLTLAKHWRTAAAAMADNAAARSVGSCVRAMPGSHIAWVSDVVATQLESDLRAARGRIEDMARSAEDCSADYQTADGSIADTIARLQGR